MTRAMRTALLNLLAAGVLAGGFAAEAQAGELNRFAGGSYLYDGGAAQNNVTVRRICAVVNNICVAGTRQMTITDVNSALVLVDDGTADDAASKCGLSGDGLTATCPDDATLVDLDGRAQNDTLRIDDTGSGGTFAAIPTDLAGEAGQDTLFGGAGNDNLWSNLQGGTTGDEGFADTLDGGGGTDILTGDGGADTMRGGEGIDTLNGHLGSDPSLDGGNGNDTVNGQDGDDTMLGGAGTDTMNGGIGNDTITPGLNDDNVVNAGEGIDTVSYNDGRTNGVTVDLTATGATDGGVDDNASPTAREDLRDFERVAGSTKDDVIRGNSVANVLTGNGGNDQLSALGGVDTLNGGDGDDVLDGGLDNDTLNGNNQNDTLLGGGNTDTLNGNDGDDTLDGGPANDALAGGNGFDTVDYSARTTPLNVSVDVVTPGTTGDGGEEDQSAPGVPTSPRDTVTTMERVLGSSDADVVVLGTPAGSVAAGNGGDDNLTAGSGGSLLDGGAGRDTLIGGTGPDVLDGGAGSDSMDGGEETDTVTYASRSEGVNVTLDTGSRDDGSDVDGQVGDRDTTTNTEALVGGSGNDELYGDGGANNIFGGGGDDTLLGGGAKDILAGGEGSDTASYADHTAPVNVTLDAADNDGEAEENDDVAGDIENATGGTGDDILTGNNDANVLRGGGGNDMLTGRPGVDAFFGDGGDDVLETRDGAQENVDCGEGNDTGNVDTDDVLAACEGVLGADRDGDGIGTPTDCDDGSPGTKPGATDVPENGVDENCDGTDSINLDKDGDGQNRPSDCDDGNAAIRPGVVEIVGNKVDENCDGITAPFPLIEAGIVNGFQSFPAFSRVITLTVTRLPAGATVVVTCAQKKDRRIRQKSKRSCAFGSKTIKVAKPTKERKLNGLFKNRKLRVGTVIKVQVTAPNMIGKLQQFTVLRRKTKRAPLTCIAPGEKPRAC